MTALKTTQFYMGVPTASGWTDIYTVPTGKVIILKTALMTNQTSSGRTAGIRIDPSMVLYSNGLTAAGTTGATIQFGVWLAFNAGSTLAVEQSAANAVLFVVSGYLLYV